MKFKTELLKVIHIKKGPKTDRRNNYLIVVSSVVLKVYNIFDYIYMSRVYVIMFRFKFCLSTPKMTTLKVLVVFVIVVRRPTKEKTLLDLLSKF